MVQGAPWRFWICNYFREIYKFRDFMNTSRNFARFVFARISWNLNISRKNLYQRNLQITCLKWYIICSYFKSMKFFGHPFWSHWESFRKNLLIKSRNQNIFEKFKLNRNLQRIRFKMMYNMSMLRHRFSNERWGGGPWTTFLPYSVKVCTSNLFI